MNNTRRVKNKKDAYDIFSNDNWLVCGKTGVRKTTLVKKMILNGVMNKKNIFWFPSHPNNDYIEPFKKQCKNEASAV